MFKTLKNKKGLTLIELIAVLVILGIIAAIAVPTIGNTINTQKERAAESQWAYILSAAELYAVQNDDVTAFSMTDLVTANNISGNVVLTDDDDSDAVIDAGDDIFTVVSGNIVIALYTHISIDGFTVFPVA